MNYNTFKKYTILLALTAILLLLANYMNTRPKTVTLDANHWQCEGTVAKGLDAVCTIYAVKGVKQ